MSPKILACLSLLAPTAASAYVLKVDPAGATVTWASKQLVFSVPESIPAGLTADEVLAAAQGAMDAWSGACRLSLQAQPATSAGAVAGAISFVESGWTYDANAVAVTVVKLDETTHQIVGADIKLNAQARRFRALAADSVPGGIYDDLQSTLTHELGHAIGLEHSADSSAVMYPQTERGDVGKRVLMADDVAGAAYLYGKSVDVPAQATAIQGLAEGMAASGCSAAPAGPPAGPMVLAALPLLALLARRRTPLAPAAVRARRAPARR